MSLFFFLSGIYVTGSYRRKGAWRFLLDRTLRLVLPCLAYSLLAPPFLDWWWQLAKNPPTMPSYRASVARWFAPGWPTKYMLPTGPPWFVWMLWCFNVAYVILQVLGSTAPGKWAKRACCGVCADVAACRVPGARPAPLPVSRGGAAGEHGGALSTREVLTGGGALALLLFALMYAARVLDILAFNIRPAAFVQSGPFVTFMPDFFPVYVACFALGVWCKPAGLARLPAAPSFAWWCLGAAGIYWTLLGFIPSAALGNEMALRRGMEAFLLSWLLRTFVEQTFAVVWSFGLLALFKGSFNNKPGRVGRVLINAAYGAYIVHMVLIPLWARAFMPVRLQSGIMYAACISGPAVLSSFGVAAALRAIPYMDRVL